MAKKKRTIKEVDNMLEETRIRVKSLLQQKASLQEKFFKENYELDRRIRWWGDLYESILKVRNRRVIKMPLRPKFGKGVKKDDNDSQ